MLCAACNAELPQDARFCSQCGERVPTQPKLLDQQDTEHNRQLTIMFCDLVDSTGMSTRHEPETYSAIVRDYLYDSTEKLESYDGQIARYIGDGIMAYFGYPQAQSDDVERAVLAALDVCRMIESQPPVSGENLAVRIGIATGRIVIGTSAGRGMAREQVAMGTTPNLAARVQGIAKANQVAICPHSFALLGDRFSYQYSGEHELKGFNQPIPVRIVTGEIAGLQKSRFRATRGNKTLALIGRDSELQTLLKASNNMTGKPNSILIRGQAGMGKSHLLHAYRTSAQIRESYYLETQCDSYRSSTFLHPFIKLLADLAHFDLQHRDESRVALTELTQSLELDDASLVEILAEFLEVGLASTKSSKLPPEGRQSRIYDAITTVLIKAACFSPVVVVFEDLHWADSSTLELLDILMRSEVPQDASITLIMTSRPNASLGVIDQGTGSTVDLNPLSSQHSLQMAKEVLGEQTIPDALLDQLLTRSAGVPIFLEALCRQVAETSEKGGGALPDNMRLPATIQSLVMEKLDRLQSNVFAVQLAATFGMRFAVDWLRETLQMTKEAFERLLETCQQLQLLTVSVSAQGSFCTFQHAMVQQVAYESMLKKQRKHQHDRVAQYFETSHPEICQDNPEMLGQHWQNAGNWEKGAEYLLIASERSAASWANKSAENQLHAIISQLTEYRAAIPKWNELWYKANVQLGKVLVSQRKVKDAQCCYESALDSCVDDPERKTRIYRRIAEAQQRDENIAMEAIHKARQSLPVWKGDHNERKWWQESLQLDLVEGLVAYWHNDTPALEKSLNKMTGKVEEYGTPQQKVEVQGHLMLLELRKHRYQVTPDALRHGEQLVRASKATNKLDRSASALFQEGFTLLFDGQYQRAEANMLEAQELALECGLKSIQVQVLVYLGTIYRCTGDIKQAETLGANGLKLAQEAEMKEYEAMALANLAWCAWYRNDFATLEDVGNKALSLWRSLPFQYPFQWAAIFPLLALAHVQNHSNFANDMVCRLAADSQQRLPAAVDELLQDAVGASNRENVTKLLLAASKQGLLFTKKHNIDKYFLILSA